MNISYGLLSAVVTSAPTEAVKAPLSLGASLQLAVSGMTIVMIALALLAVLVLIMNKIVPSILGTNKAKPAAPVASAPVVVQKSPEAAAPAPALAPGMAILPANQSQGELNLYDVDDKTAAMIMAIVSDSTKIPLNELYFKSIKSV